MMELLLVFMAGFLGSSHCVGMCGGFALSIGGASPSLWRNTQRQLSYTAGRVFTYSVLGAFMGFGGWRLSREFPALVNAPAVLALIAGVLLVYQGLATANVLPRRSRSDGRAPCLAGSLLANFLTAPGFGNVFLAGVFTGLLPCGLLYAMLALAGGTGDVFKGMAVMAIFGLGTAPLMLLAGCGGSLLTLRRRQHMLKIAAWCVVLTGVVSLVRGVSFLQLSASAAPACLFCN